MAQNKNGSLRDLQRTTALLSGLLAKEAKALDARRRGEGEGDMKALKEITAGGQGVAAGAKRLGEQGGGRRGRGDGGGWVPPPTRRGGFGGLGARLRAEAAPQQKGRVPAL